MFEKIQKIICEQLGLPAEKVKMESALIDDLGCDSLDVVDLTVTAEDEFGLTIPEDQLASILTVGDLVKYLEEHTEKK